MKEIDFDSFFSKGYLYVEKLFNLEEIDKIKTCCNEIEELASTITSTQLLEGTQFVVEGDRIDRAVWAGAYRPYLLKIAEDNRILALVSKLLGSHKMDHLINQIHFKRPGDKVEFVWHQDSEHRRYGSDLWKDVNKNGSYIQTVLAIDPMTDENGPLMVFEGSSKNGHLDLNHNQGLFDKIKEEDALIINMKPGDLLLFGPYLIHGSKANNSNQARRVFINGYSYPGANSRDYPGTGSGRKLEFN